MGYRKVDCPICGNECPINTNFEFHKCLFCKRGFKVTYKGKGKNKHVIEATENESYNIGKEVALDTTK